MALKDWKKIENQARYIEWEQYPLPKGNYNIFFVVVKTEEGKWVSFVSAGEAGTSILQRGKTKNEVMPSALRYMRTH